MSLERERGTAERGELGMSLIELSIVLAIMGMMAFIGLPSMQEWLDRYRVRTAAAEIGASIQLQRMRAVSQNQDFSIAFDQVAGTYALFQGDPDTGTALDVMPRALPRMVEFSGDSTDSVQLPNDRIIFHPDGSLNDRAAITDQIFLGNAHGDVFLITINRATGRVQVQSQSYGY